LRRTRTHKPTQYFTTPIPRPNAIGRAATRGTNAKPPARAAKKAAKSKIETQPARTATSLTSVAPVVPQHAALELTSAAIPEIECEPVEFTLALKYAIYDQFDRVHCWPDPDLWAGKCGTVWTICRSLTIPVKQSDSVVRVLNRAIVMDEDGAEYDGSRMPAGRPPLIVKVGSAEEMTIAKLSRAGVGDGLGTNMLYQEGVKMSEDTYYRAKCRAGGLCEKAGSKKSGKVDPGCTWAKARLAQCEMLNRMLSGKDMKKGEWRIYADGIFFFDQRHQKCQLGGTCGMKHLWRYPINPETGDLLAESEGGVMQEPRSATTVKFPKEARHCFGVASPTEGGTRTSYKADPFCYTGRLVIGVKRYKKEQKAELRRVLPMKGCWKTAGYGYKERWPQTWEQQLKTKLDQKYCCVTEMIDWLVEEAREAFKGTAREDDFSIYGDGLSSFWEKGAQEYFEETYPAEFSRLIRCVGSVNKDTRYHGKVVGDSPEVSSNSPHRPSRPPTHHPPPSNSSPVQLMPLDCNLFADLKRGICWHRALTYNYSDNDNEKFKFGTPDEVEATVERVWEVCPSPDRVIQDTDRWVHNISTIIKADGIVVYDLNPRHGRRAVHNVTQMTAVDLHEDALRGKTELLSDTKFKV
jgi:hypothetical protein